MSALAIAQDEKGWLANETMDFVAQYLGMPPIAVYEVATFYNMYNLQPLGKYKITVCTNLPCALVRCERCCQPRFSKNWVSASMKRPPTANLR